jgi:peptidoglycan hydrolase-like protein with peptidoglycan-binding domain
MTTLNIGSSGTEVGQLQQVLIEAGIHINNDELQKQIYGQSTADAVKSYQTAHGLTADGVVGPKTWASFNSASADDGPFGWKVGTLPPDVDPVIKQALCLVGTVEVPPGSNRGVEIDKLNTAAGIPLGSPWCAAFATGMWQHSPKKPFGPMGSAFKVKDWGDHHKASVANTGVAQPGDIFVILRADGHGHVGLVTCDLGDSVATVEGNAGNAVKKLIRKKADLVCFVRPLGISLGVA